MRIGLGLPVAGAWATPDRVAEFARSAEELGYHSLWTFQRLYVGADQDLEPVYRSVLDPVVALAYAAAHTTRIRLGVAVLNLPFVAPVVLAKQAASLDVLSGGRLDLGLGTGWSPVEFTATGADPRHRGAQAREYVRMLRTLWSGEGTAIEGRFSTLPAGAMLPRPVQQPGPPILLGGSAPAALRRAGQIADGWVSRSGQDLDRIAEDIAVVQAAAAEAGREPVRIVCRGVLREHGPLSGPPERIREGIARLGAQGVTEVFYDLNWDPLIGSPDADPDAATARARRLIAALAP